MSPPIARASDDVLVEAHACGIGATRGGANLRRLRGTATFRENDLFRSQ